MRDVTKWWTRGAILALAVAAPATSSAQEEEGEWQEVESALWLAEADEIALARSAAPTAVSASATIHVLGNWGYEEGDDWALKPQILVHAPYAQHSSLGMDEEAGKSARWSGLPHLDWAGGPMTSIVVPMELSMDAQSSTETGSQGGSPESLP